MQKARDRNTGPLAYYKSGLALCAYFGRDLAEARRLIMKSGATGHPLYHLIAAAICGEAGDIVCAQTSRRWLDMNAPQLSENAQQELAVRLGRPEDLLYFVGSLAKAGFIIPDVEGSP